MSGFRYNISLFIVLISLFSVQAFSQGINYSDSIALYNPQKVALKPQLHYSLGSTFTFIPHYGSVTGFTISPFLSVPISPKLSVDGGIVVGRYYSTLPYFNSEGVINGAFNEISLFGSANYHISPQLTLYGAGIKQVAGTSPFLIPKSSYLIGSSYNFGEFSIGVSVQMSKWNNLNSLPFNEGFYSPYEPGPVGR